MLVHIELYKNFFIVWTLVGTHVLGVLLVCICSVAWTSGNVNQLPVCIELLQWPLKIWMNRLFTLSWIIKKREIVIHVKLLMVLWRIGALNVHVVLFFIWNTPRSKCICLSKIEFMTKTSAKNSYALVASACIIYAF